MEGLGGDWESWGDNPSKVASLSIDDIEGYGRSEIDNNSRKLPELCGGRGIGQTVRTDRARIRIGDVDTSRHTVIHPERPTG